jgi:hypothetical protein
MKKILSLAASILLALPVAAQSDDAMKEIVGVWQTKFTAPDGAERSPYVVIGRQHQELVAWAVESGEPERFKNVKLEGDTLVLTLRPREASNVTVTLKATAESDGVCVGTGVYTTDDGDTGSWQFRGKRLSPSEYGETQEWQLNFVSPEGDRYEVAVLAVSVDGKLYGWCKTAEYELPATKLALDGNRVTLSVSAKTRNGEEVDITFRGSLSGDSIRGEATYEVNGESGSFPFQGRRAS